MLKKPFRYLPHTADAKFVAYGSSFKIALENAALAMLGIMFETDKIKNSKLSSKSVALKEAAHSKEDLVWYTLQGILSKADELSLHAYAFRVAKLEERKDTLRLSGFLLYKNVGDKFSLMDIKAITPHELSVINKNGRFEITVVADV